MIAIRVKFSIIRQGQLICESDLATTQSHVTLFRIAGIFEDINSRGSTKFYTSKCLTDNPYSVEA